MKIAFIGIGAMGEPMAANLLKKGHAVNIVRHRRPASVSKLESAGAKVCASPAEAMRGCDAAFLSLPTSREVNEVIEGKGGLMETAGAGTVIADCSTSAPDETRRLHALLAKKDIALVDAPVTRGVAGAKQGALAFFLGGSHDHIEKIMPALKAMGDTFVHVGPIGHAHYAKVISNVLSYSTVALVNEAFMLGSRGGLKPAALYDALTQGTPSKALEAFGSRIASGEYEPVRVTVDHACADMVLAQELAAKATVPAFLLNAAEQIYRTSSSRGSGERDISAIAEDWRK